MASSGQLAFAAATSVAANGTAQTVKFRDGTVVPAVGQGSAGLGRGRHPAAEEEEALRTGLSLGMTLIDTSGDYGAGRSEELIKRVIAGQRGEVRTRKIRGRIRKRAEGASAQEAEGRAY
jgi:aryl-alcohol dehydrogenase-like predicted oxidoreductase